MSRSTSHVYEHPPEDSAGRGFTALPATLVFDRDSVRAIDREATSQFGLAGIVLMENAARGLADEAMKMLRAAADPSPLVLIICGMGNNGGDGYAAARHLHNRGAQIVLAPLGEPRSGSDAAINYEICAKMGLSQIDPDDLDQFAADNHISLIIDAIYGTGLDRPVSGRAAEIIEWINGGRRPVLAADVPSGMDCQTGTALGLAVKATRTVTFVGLKPGFIGLDAQKLLGEVVVKDIGAPRELLERYGRPIDVPELPPEPATR